MKHESNLLINLTKQLAKLNIQLHIVLERLMLKKHSDFSVPGFHEVFKKDSSTRI